MEHQKTLTVALLGCGSRGYAFGSYMNNHKERFQLTALCDINPAQLKKCQRAFGLSDELLFSEEERFFEVKRADFIYISTFDKEHVRECIRAMRLGYDVLLEKPISDSREEIAALLDAWRETGRTVAVCHELRYGIMYEKLYELLQSGCIGKLIAIDSFERVAYWHMAQAYVRLQSAVNDVAHPTILAKCSHDLDLLQHFAGARSDTVSSVGGLSYFRKENAPVGAASRCVDCPHRESCAYSAKKIYIDRWKRQNKPAFIWPFNKVSLTNPTTEEALWEGLRTGVLGKCVYLCGVEENLHVTDHQLVQVHFENGVDASLKMVFGATAGRRINLFGSDGELLLDERRNVIEVMPYGAETQVISGASLFEGGSAQAHGGGDTRLIEGVYDILNGKTNANRTSLEESVECHLMGIAAEESRLAGGMLVKVHK